jgi:hypothetical protein
MAERLSGVKAGDLVRQGTWGAVKGMSDVFSRLLPSPDAIGPTCLLCCPGAR